MELRFDTNSLGDRSGEFPTGEYDGRRDDRNDRELTVALFRELGRVFADGGSFPLALRRLLTTLRESGPKTDDAVITTAATLVAAAVDDGLRKRIDAVCRQGVSDGAAEGLAGEPVSSLEARLEAVEREMIVEALTLHGGNITEAAKHLHLTRRMLGLRLEKYRISYKDFRKGRKGT